MNNVTLIIPTYRNPKYLDLCLHSAIENRADPSNQILVIVDGFFDENKDVLEKYSDVLYLDLQQNRGMQYAINAGVMQAMTNYVFVINDDNVMPTLWDSRLLKVVDNMDSWLGHDKWCLTVNQIEPTGPGMFNFPVLDLGQTTETFNYEEWLRKEITYSVPGETPDGHIFPFVLNKKYFLAVGGLDTFYGSPNVCDWDFFLKLELLKFKFLRTHSLHLYHFGSVSTKKNSESQSFREREQQAFSEFEWKWGTPPYNGQHNSKVHPTGYRGFKV